MALRTGASTSSEILSVLRNDRQRWFGIACMALCIGLLVAGVVGNSDLGRVPDQLGFYFLISLPVWAVWRVVCARIVVSTQGLTVANWVRVFEIPWGAVRSIESDDELRLVLMDGRIVRPSVGQGSLVGAAHGSPAQRALRERISALRKTADPAEAHLTQRLDFGARMALPILISGALLTIVLTVVRG